MDWLEDQWMDGKANTFRHGLIVGGQNAKSKEGKMSRNDIEDE